MLKISEVLRVNDDVLNTANPEDTVLSVVHTMREYNRGAVLIMESGQLVGLVTFYDIMCLLDKNQGQLGDTRLRSIMNDAPITVSPNTSVTEVQRLMLDHAVRYIPVLDGPMVMGVITLTDVARALFRAQQFETTLLKAYIKELNEIDGQ